MKQKKRHIRAHSRVEIGVQSETNRVSNGNKHLRIYMDGEENLTEEGLGFADISRRWEVDAVQTKPVARKEVWKGERWKVVENWFRENDFSACREQSSVVVH